MDKIGIVINPLSGGGAAGRIEPWLRLRLGPRLDACSCTASREWVDDDADFGHH